MGALKSLVRVHTWALNEKRQKLARLEQLRERLNDDLQRLQEEQEKEQRAASSSMEGTIAYPTFIAAALERRKRLRESIAKLEEAIEAAREDVNAEYREVRKYELARDNFARRQRYEQARRDQIGFDELGGQIHRRRQVEDDDEEES